MHTIVIQRHKDVGGRTSYVNSHKYLLRARLWSNVFNIQTSCLLYFMLRSEMNRKRDYIYANKILKIAGMGIK